MTLTDTADRKTFGGVQLHADDMSLIHALKTTAQVGLGALPIFEHIFEPRFKLLTIDLDLTDMRSFL
jgi:hypothetical protein